MSRIGKKTIKIPAGVKVSQANGVFHVEGKLGKQDVLLGELVHVTVKDEGVVVERADETKEARSVHGLIRMLIHNAIHGVSEGFHKELNINGVGYRAEVRGKTLLLTLGYSHPVEYGIPEGIKVEAKTQTQLLISGCSKTQVGQTAAEIRAYRQPEPYKGKGIKYSDEVILRKVGKSAAGGK